MQPALRPALLLVDDDPTLLAVLARGEGHALFGVLGGIFLSWMAALLLTHALGAWNLHIEPWAIGPTT